VAKLSQVEKTFTAKSSRDPVPRQDIQDNPHVLLGLLAEKQRRVFNSLLYFQNRYQSIYVSQEFLAHCGNMCRDWVNKTIKLLTKLGLVTKNYRHKKTCTYRISSMFLNEPVRKLLRPFFPALKLFVLNLLISWGSPIMASNQHIAHDSAQLTNINLLKQHTTRLYRGSPDSARGLSEPAVAGTGTSDVVVVSEILKKVTKQLNLTKWGQIDLMGYPKEALEYALGHYLRSMRSGKIGNPWGWFITVVDTWCQARKILPDTALVNRLKMRFSVPRRAPKIRTAVEQPGLVQPNGQGGEVVVVSKETNPSMVMSIYERKAVAEAAVAPRMVYKKRQYASEAERQAAVDRANAFLAGIPTAQSLVSEVRRAGALDGSLTNSTNGEGNAESKPMGQRLHAALSNIAPIRP
jgi:hypothetical protein